MIIDFFVNVFGCTIISFICEHNVLLVVQFTCIVYSFLFITKIILNQVFTYLAFLSKYIEDSVVAWSSVCYRAAVLLLFISCLLLLLLFVEVLCLVLVLLFSTLCTSSFANILMGKRE